MPRTAPLRIVASPRARKAGAAPPEPPKTRAARPRPADATSADATRRIADSITTAIVERRLMPGTKLAEQPNADVFKVSRTLVRQALMQLSRDHLVTLEPARGARVAEPGVEEARDVFEARHLLEVALVKRAARDLSAPQIARLRQHLAAEADALLRTDVPGRTRLLADFHVVLAQLVGNEVLASILKDLVSRCSLIALMYQSAHSAGHSAAEHVAIVDALAARDARGAVRLMQAPLHNVEHHLRLHPRVPADLRSALRPADAVAAAGPRAHPRPHVKKRSA